VEKDAGSKIGVGKHMGGMQRMQGWKTDEACYGKPNTVSKLN